MLELKFIRANPELVTEHLNHKGIENGALLVDELLTIDAERREVLTQVEELKRERNALSAQVARAKKAGESADEWMNRSREIGETIAELDATARVADGALDEALLQIPNIHHPSAPIGAGEDDNVLVRSWGTPRAFDFEPKPHYEIGEKLGILDFENAAKISGARFYILKNAGARLERALISFMLDVHTQNGYEEVLPPVLVRSSAMQGAGILPKFAEDAYKLENEDLWLIPTAEVPVTAIHADQILDAAQLPIKYAAYSACFRSEAGSAGRDTRGVIRVHQFNKIELVWFASPENSYGCLEQLRRDAETILERLELPYRTMEHCTGDLGFKATKSYDPEVWFPSQNAFREISSCSNFEAFQARRLGIKYRLPSVDGKPGKTEFVHTLNGSALAVGRTFAAILENFQNSDGSVTVPGVLRPYLNGIEKIG